MIAILCFCIYFFVIITIPLRVIIIDSLIFNFPLDVLIFFISHIFLLLGIHLRFKNRYLYFADLYDKEDL